MGYGGVSGQSHKCDKTNIDKQYLQAFIYYSDCCFNSIIFQPFQIDRIAHVACCKEKKGAYIKEVFVKRDKRVTDEAQVNPRIVVQDNSDYDK